MNRTPRSIHNLQLLSLGVLILVLFAYEPGWAANHYVHAAATGSGNGSDWTNACTDFTGSCAVASLVRGDTYYVATGTYASVTFNTAESGTLVITIKGATANDHGTNTGWLNSYGVDVTQATFNFLLDLNIAIKTSYWTIDGSVGSGNTASAFGFLMAKPANCATVGEYQAIFVGTIVATTLVTDATVKHVAAIGCGPAFDVAQYGLFAGSGASYVTNSTFSYSFFDGMKGSWSATNVANSTWEHNWSQNQWSSSKNHGESFNIKNGHFSVGGRGNTSACAVELCTDNNTFRYNIVLGCHGTACLAFHNPRHDAAPNFKIYGNIFEKTDGGNGVIAIADTATTYMHNAKIYNNTIINSGGTIVLVCQDDCSGASGNEFYNNLLYNSSSTLNAGKGTLTHDYNAYISASDVPPAEANGQIRSINPFVDYASGNYQITSGTKAGLTLDAPYNIDPLGKIRGADGVWDSGAFEFAGPNRSPVPPNSLRVH